MPYTLWTNGRKIGETSFEMPTTGKRRAGLFSPTAFGLTQLPAIADMLPALLAFGDLCRREGIDTDDDRPETAAAALDSFGGTSEGQRVIAAAKKIAAVTVVDPSGRSVRWDTLAINDLERLATVARIHKPGENAVLANRPGSGTYIVSLTLDARAGRLPDAEHFGAQRRESAPH